MRVQDVDVYVHRTRLRGMFQSGGEVYRWFGRKVTPFIATDMRKYVAKHTRSGRLLRSLYTRTQGTNQYLLHVVAGSHAEHAPYFIANTLGRMIVANGNKGGTKPTMAVGFEYTKGISLGGPKDPKSAAPGIQWGVDSVRGSAGHNFIEEAVDGVLRRRRLL